jgi:uncharacterized damage-inducible protein DinB
MNPYAQYVHGEDPVVSLASTPERIDALVRGWSPEQWEQPWQPGKWTARQILIHLAQAEMVFSNRLRFALAEPGYVLQPFDQDRWMAVEPLHSAMDALNGYLALRRLTLPIAQALTSEQRARKFVHPEKGDIDVEWVLRFFAGHERHHLPQLEAVGSKQ